MSSSDQSYRTAAEETWRIFRIIAEFVEGFDVMSRVGPAVSVFGSARTQPGDPYYQQAVELSSQLSRRGFAIITGGGPGIMEAANRGAAEAGGKSIGLNIALPMEQLPNSYQNISLDFHYFFARKVMFVKYAVAFVCFPGGFGTMDEFFESMTLIQTGKALPMKVVLIGREFWGGLDAWMRETMLNRFANISPGDLELYTLTDDISQAVELIDEHYREYQARSAAPAAGADVLRSPDERLTAEGTLYGVGTRARPRMRE